MGERPEPRDLEVAHADDAGTQDELVRRYQRRVYAVVHRMTGQHHADVEDLCQETFLQVFKGIPKLRDGSNLDSWVYRVALNVSVDHLRRRTRERASHQRLAAERAQAGASPPPPATELEQAVRGALAQLPDDQRAVLVLRMFEGLSHEEIAAIQAAPVATVRWRLHAARQKMERLLAPYLEDPSV